MKKIKWNETKMKIARDYKKDLLRDKQQSNKQTNLEGKIRKYPIEK